MKGAVVYAFHLIGKIPVLKVIGADNGINKEILRFATGCCHCRIHIIPLIIHSTAHGQEITELNQAL